MLDVPNIEVTKSWSLSWTGYLLDQRSRNRSAKTISNRRSSVMLMARWFTSQGIEPEDVTKGVMKTYVASQLEGRQGSGASTMFNDARSFWDWYSADYETPNPMTGIPRPKGACKPVPVLKPEELRKVLAAAADQLNPKLAARDTAMIWLALESGLRRAELAALDVDDVDLLNRTVAVRCGKFGKFRISVFGDSTAMALHKHMRKGEVTEGPLFPSVYGHRLSLHAVGADLSKTDYHRM